jgi:hypothetical protein
MKLVAWLLLAAVITAAAQAVAVALVAAIALTIVWALVVAPRQVLGLVLIGAALALINRYPIACIIAAGLAARASRSGSATD